MSDAVSIQLEIRMKKPVGVEPTQELLDHVVRAWANSGKAPRGMKISIIDWKRGRTSTSASSRSSSQEDARLRFRGLLQAGRFTVNLRSD
jgi:hypothetical protein